MNLLKRIFGGKPANEAGVQAVDEKGVVSFPKGLAEPCQFKWLEVGPQNPFGVRVLDCRPFTQTATAFTTEKVIAERYNLLRASNGRDLISETIPHSVRFPASLRFPHNGAQPEGVVFKAPSMDFKWDIYIYDSVFLFARSWTGELRYRGFARVSAAEICVGEIECPRSDTDMAASHVYFLIATHAMRRLLPHRLPKETPEDPMTMARVSFSLFGRLGCYATFDDVTGVPITRPNL